MATCDELSYAINGADLSDPDLGFMLLTGTEYAPAVAPRNATILIPGYHGSIPNYRSPLPPILVTLVVRVLGADSTTLRTNYTRFMSLLGVGTNAPVALARVRGDHVDTADARLVSTTAPTFSAANRWIDVTLILEIQRGYWQGSMQEFSLSTGAGDQPFPPALVSSAPIAGMLIRVIGPLTVMSLLDRNSGTGLRWGGLAVTAAQSLLIDTATMQAWVRTGTSWDPGPTGLQPRWITIEGSGMFTPTPRTTFLPGTGLVTTANVSISLTGATGATQISFRASPSVF